MLTAGEERAVAWGFGDPTTFFPTLNTNDVGIGGHFGDHTVFIKAALKRVPVKPGKIRRSQLTYVVG